MANGCNQIHLCTPTHTHLLTYIAIAQQIEVNEDTCVHTIAGRYARPDRCHHKPFSFTIATSIIITIMTTTAMVFTLVVAKGRDTSQEMIRVKRHAMVTTS